MFLWCLFLVLTIILPFIMQILVGYTNFGLYGISSRRGWEGGWSAGCGNFLWVAFVEGSKRMFCKHVAFCFFFFYAKVRGSLLLCGEAEVVPFLLLLIGQQLCLYSPFERSKFRWGEGTNLMSPGCSEASEGCQDRNVLSSPYATQMVLCLQILWNFPQAVPWVVRT